MFERRIVYLIPMVLWLLSALSGCSALVAEKSGSVGFDGVWESVGFVPYARLEFKASGAGVLVAVYGEESFSVFTLKNFTTVKDGFTVDVSEISGTGHAEKLNGSFFNGQLNLKGEADDDDGVWFTKADKLSAFRLFATAKLKSYQDQQ